MIKLLFYISFLSVCIAQSELSERYTTLSEIESQLNLWHDEFSNNTDPYNYPGEEGIIYHHEIIGYSGVDNLPIWAVKLTMNADLTEDKPKVLILGQCHAEEIYGVEIAMNLIERLLYPVNYPSQYQAIYAIMQNVEIWVVPTHNPDGLSVVHGWYDENNQWIQDVYYRKNKFDVNNNNNFDFVVGPGEDIDGVDLNRNYDFNWIFGDDEDALDSGGCNPSYITNYDYYRGPYPFSEPEIIAVRNFALEKNFLLSIAYHSSRSGCVSEKVIYPWEWTETKQSPDFSIVSRLGIEIAELIPKEAESGNYYPVGSQSRKGNAHDWFYSNTGCIQYLIEVGTENMQPDDVNLIESTIENNMTGVFHLLKRAGGLTMQNGPDAYQITGIVSDQSTGAPLQAEVQILELDGPMLEPRYADSFGRYRRLLVEGTYTIKFDLFGYDEYAHTFVPSSSQPTELNVNLIPSQSYDLDLSMSLPNDFDENLEIILSSDGFVDTLQYSQNGMSYGLPHEHYRLEIKSNNLFPEVVEFELNQHLNFDFDLTWKAVSERHEFNSFYNWDVNGDFFISDGVLSTQEDLFYDNMQNYSMTTLNDFGSVDDSIDFMIDVSMKTEFEWDLDYLSFSLSCSTCQNDVLKTISNHDWNWTSFLIPFEVYDGFPRKLNLNFYSDYNLHYRGARIDYLSVMYRPENECAIGDVILDGVINVVDIIGVVNIILDDEFSSFEKCVSDLNFDEAVDVSDVVQIIDLITGE